MVGHRAIKPHFLETFSKIVAFWTRVPCGLIYEISAELSE